jgi:hypothetical protein
VLSKNLIDAIQGAGERRTQAWLDQANSDLPAYDTRHFQERLSALVAHQAVLNFPKRSWLIDGEAMIRSA